MRAFLTGGTGFVGGALARRLRARGDGVIALVRDESRAGELRQLGCELVVGELPETEVSRVVGDCDAVFHVGGMYRVGIKRQERLAMHRANIEATEAILSVAAENGGPRFVYVSTLNALGDTGGRVVDESYRRTDLDYLSYYDETKHLAHRAAERAAEAGAPVIIVMPSQVYGPGDHSELGDMMRRAAAGKLPALVFAEAGICMVHVDDLADGIIRAHDVGSPGASYALAGECLRVGELIERVSAVAGRPPPRITIPTGLLRRIAPAGPLVGRLLGMPPNLGEVVRTSDGVTFWANADRARRELGWRARPLDDGLRQLFGATGAI